ncbi:peptide chain release factor N(5)-glutamine methyltransferase [Balneolaceae bacterium YR4-1]|uniref:Release factor glutamine methyltransferase n=1 Tax=Halalkalibaculum roseum TaxID=2709311 RepID=A0A6M1T5Q4_9BACT|nr:peptide chain release factor N(5)-glutamine methyltransferase [Halalkalibaculum roseum]NGP78107.1 peptide chain release factor N(5)-glutamine methyltransferase [Halalkalibaculum roseum]
MSTKLKDWTVLSMLEWGTEYFKERGIPDPRLSIEWLLAETLQVKRLDLYLKFDRPLSQTELDNIRPLVKRRAKHEPLQYILGYTEFMNAHITVSPEVLIPRIETEQLVEILLDDHPSDEGSEEKKVIDIGTGSGCIPIALKMERPDWQVDALDISKEAIRIARENAENNEVDVNFISGNILQWKELPLEGSYDIIISNPPYVLPEEKEELEEQVVRHEPSLALFCDNLEKMYGSVIRFSEKYLQDQGMLYLEVHEKYGEQIQQLFDDTRWETSLLKDYDKKPRFIIAKLA